MNKAKYGNQLTKTLIGKIIRSTIIYTIVFIMLWIIGRFFCKLITWQEWDPVYRILTGIGYNLFVLIVIWLMGFIVIFVYHLNKTLSYIDAIVEASEVLVENNEEWIKLPSDLIEIEERMNLVKRQSLHHLQLAREQTARKNDLIVYLAHDIKTPLTSMIGYLSLLDEIKNMPSKQREKYIATALDKSYKLEELMNELFDITRFNSETILLEKNKINLYMMLEQIADDFYPLLKEMNKKIRIESETKITLDGDSDKLARVFNNVIKNAIHYSSDHSCIRVMISQDKEYANVVICNKGKKIPEDKLKSIFEKFYRLDSARTSRTGGSGLGLAIAKEIVELHGGKITAASDELETKFIIQLPLD